MKSSTSTLELAPRFQKRNKKKGTRITLDEPAYIRLLVRANVTDATLWPPGTERGAAALKRIRSIERRCINKIGYFDWERLTPKVQDEYDGLCAFLNELQDSGPRVVLRELSRQETIKGS